MKIFLVGGFGFIGRRFIRTYSDVHEITVYATQKDIQNAKKILNLENVSVEEGFIEDEKLGQIIKKHNPDVVIHLAALTGLVKCHKDPQKAFKINVFGTYNVINACIESFSKLIFLSSREVYGETRDSASKEDDQLHPKNVYGITKMIAEQLIETSSKKNSLNFTILRLTNVYGPEGDQYGAQVIIKNALHDKKIQILGGAQRLNYVFVDDVIEVINIVLQNKKSSNQIFNVGSKDTVNIKDFAHKITDFINEKIEFEHKPMRETETTNFEPDLSKLKHVLGYDSQTSLEQGIKKTIEWYKKN
jgi:UDP-glucose 4-epimerase